MNWHLFASTFALIFLAELPDKTALATLIMASRGRPFAIFTGAALAFVIQTIIAVLFGSLFGAFPQKWVHLAAGILFIAFAVMAWRGRKDDDEENERLGKGASAAFWRSAWNAFVVIFIAEWGDLTQLASASLVARYHAPGTIFISSILALWSATGIAVIAGHTLKKAINPEIIEKVGAVVFAGVGVYFLFTWAQGS